ncbi:MAG: hypothetical protein IPJ65_34240 [Archangiaceae bacterium]|nr:hypothetical protein [Archangiaceae bacterium]
MQTLSALTAALLLAVPDSVYDNPAAWQPEETDGELQLEARAIENSSWLEYRVKTSTELTPQALCDTTFEQVTKGKPGENVKSRKLLKDEPEVRVLYDLVDAPMVSTRDYAMTVTKLPGEGGCRIRFKITNELAPALPSGVVRMEKMWGGWNFEARGGKTQITHFLYADPAGAVPAFIARGTQKKSIKEAVRRMIIKTREGGAAGPK